jgi:Nucleotidyl transferase AbiEii toxin, Type IV TA system
VNATPDLPASATPAGPTLAPEELAGNKLLALFDRAAARDFADIYILARRFGKEVLLARAAQIDAGFDVRVLADMIATSTGSPWGRRFVATRELKVPQRMATALAPFPAHPNHR